MSTVLGISFGNTSSSIALSTKDGKVDVIANPDGDRAIPSVLSYVGEDEYHGAQAKSQLIRNPKNTIVNFRDFVGKKYDEVDISASKLGSPAIKSANGSISYEIQRGSTTESLTVEEVTKRHFKKLKEAAEDYTGKKVEGVVIAVPTNYTEEQKAELSKVLDASGLKSLQVINEPSAALLAHLSAKEDRSLEDKVYVVADFGGIRSDVAVIAVRGGIMTILSTSHKLGLGGDKLDDVLAEYFAKEFEKKYKANPRNNARSLAKLKSESIVVKKTLSNVQTSTCSIESLAEGIDFHTSINRLRYEVTARQVLSEMSSFLEEAVKKSGLETIDIDEVLLVGGTSHTPKLAADISFIFPETTVVTSPALDSKALNPSELIARGAALQASLIEGFDESEIKESLQPIVVNTQHLVKPIGIKDSEGNFVTLLHAETAFPIKKTLEVTNGDSDAVSVELFEGERTVKETVIEPEQDSDDSEDEEEEPEIKRTAVYVSGNKLAELALKDLKPNAKLEIIINISNDGVLNISARELKQGSVAVKGQVSSSS
ncbi:Piso0_004449 [Millerozyma farinosa CBS 7064]|uniref:Piso0_004449 protein n=1 Tax=Pichia sorbitophila (strain ATCC MYA-4447 / BCRC 22081 / CBS 7064 / NBRC 10061 / NRRL Y-12695) TaxID=559304 RepID=G8Y5H9_PICSO|nr:Piso0_004449 [Millerozyma farinosa CBS 7064]CCE84890.1 Piso0_004449 [Millerozyma farinosa CBS 7064]